MTVTTASDVGTTTIRIGNTGMSEGMAALASRCGKRADNQRTAPMAVATIIK